MLNLLIEQASLRLPPGSRPIHGAFPEIQCGISLYIINQIANTLITFSGSFLRLMICWDSRNRLRRTSCSVWTERWWNDGGTSREGDAPANFGVNAFNMHLTFRLSGLLVFDF